MKLDLMCVGLGSLGSYAYTIINQRFFLENSVLIDPDVVAEHNIYNSAFASCHINKPKISALYQNSRHIRIEKKFEDYVMEKLFSNKLPSSSDLFDPDQCNIIICAVDSMNSRKNVFEYFKVKENAELFIDLRGSKDQIRIYLITKSDIEFYESRFYPDSDVVDMGCDAIITQFNAKLCALFLLEELKKYILGEIYRREIVFDVPGLSILCESSKEKKGVIDGSDRRINQES